MRTDLFDFDLPEGAIALHPAQPRDAARLLVVRPVKGGCAGDDADLTDKIVSDLPSLLQPGDALVFNDTRVIPAALSGIRVRGETQAKVDFNLTKRVSDNSWRAFARPAKRLEAGDRVHFGHSGDSCMMGALDATVSAKGEAGEVELAFDFSGDVLDDAIRAVGAMPLPPYIALKRDADECDRVVLSDRLRQQGRRRRRSHGRFAFHARASRRLRIPRRVAPFRDAARWAGHVSASEDGRYGHSRDARRVGRSLGGDRTSTQ